MSIYVQDDTPGVNNVCRRCLLPAAVQHGTVPLLYIQTDHSFVQTYVQIGKGKVVKVTGIHNKGRTATCLLRGSNKLVLEEAERSLHDALCVVRCLVHKKFLIAGGAAPEVELVTQLSKWAKTLQVSPRYLIVVCVSQLQLLA